MNLNNLSPAKGAVKTSKRLGRGQGSGRGGTSARGHKGAGSRSGYSSKGGFEGGQMPLQRRLPKFGFKNINRVEFRGINLDVIQKMVEAKGLTEITLDVLVANGLASKNNLVKILGKGELKAKLNVTVHAFTATAKAAIEAAGGQATTI